jgi:hypothetical protein
VASYEYPSKQQLIDTIHTLYLLLDAEFEGMGDSHKDIRVKEVDKTPAEIIAYQLGWLHLVQGWDKEEREGRKPAMPSADYKWNQLGAMYQSFYTEYAACSLSELRDLFRMAEQQWLTWIDTFTEEELFVQGFRKWTGTKANWPLARWIHINSAAPFKSFRATLRKWKKHAPSLETS